MAIDEEQASGLIEKWAPKILKHLGFGAAERAVLMENAVWVVKKTAEMNARLEGIAKSVLDNQAELVTIRADVTEARRQLDALTTATLVAGKKTRGA